MVSTCFGHAYATVWDSRGNQTSFDFSPLEGWREYDGPPPVPSLPVIYVQVDQATDDALVNEFEKRVAEQPDNYNLFTNNCWQALGKVANPILSNQTKKSCK